MRFEPVNKWVVGRAAVSKRPGIIVAPNAAKGVTRFYLIEEVGKEAEAAGYKSGDLVVAHHAFDMFFHGGTVHRITFSIDEVVCRVHDVKLEDLSDVFDKPFVPVGNGNGTAVVPPEVTGAPA